MDTSTKWLLQTLTSNRQSLKLASAAADMHHRGRLVYMLKPFMMWWISCFSMLSFVVRMWHTNMQLHNQLGPILSQADFLLRVCFKDLDVCLDDVDIDAEGLRARNNLSEFKSHMSEVEAADIGATFTLLECAKYCRRLLLDVLQQIEATVIPLIDERLDERIRQL